MLPQAKTHLTPPLPPSLVGADKRSVILRAAHALFLRDGFSATSMDAVTREAGVSKATVYAHFDGKQALFEALLQAGCEDGLATAPQLVRRGGDPADELITFFEPFLTLIITGGNYAWDRMVIAEASRHPANARLFHECTVGRLTGSVERYLGELDREGRIAPVDLRLAAEAILATAFLGPLHRTLMIGPPEADLLAALRFGVTLLLRGLAPGNPTTPGKPG